MKNNDPITTLPGVGEKRAEAFKQENIITINDLLNFIPIRYEDRTKIGTFKNENSEITVKAKVLDRGKLRFVRKNYNILVIPVEDSEGNKGDIVFFNQPYLVNRFIKGQTYFFYGRVSKDKNKTKIFSPKFADLNDSNFLQINPIYKKLKNIPASLVQRLIRKILEDSKLNDFIPEKYLSRYGFISLLQMFQKLHLPNSTDEIEQAKRRFKLNEGLKINAGIISNKKNREITDLVLTNFNCINPFLKKLPFDLTDSQNHVLREIFQDLESGFLMNRMIQGDVGSGKTIIAIICAYLFCLNGLQVAYMAPTEILAKQHYETFKEYFKDFNINIALLTGSKSNKDSEKIRNDLRNGNINIVIGTHSLFQEKTEFYNLGLIVTDEQHRFGVKQRGQLENKGLAHVLVMSATPIPRTLALTFYGDLDLSIIDQMPLGRKKIKTSVHSIKKLNQILKFTEEEIKAGHQAFVVCPYIEESEESTDVISVEKAFSAIKKKFGDRLKIERLHSKLTNEEKEVIINSFNHGEIDLLVATSIIEVGINVPNVSVIIILSADRFGLSQLHQLRGRTGRSDIQSYCFLVSDKTNDITQERLNIIVNSHNGQEIAEADLALRGPGEYFGFQQHGFNRIKHIDPIKDRELFELSKLMVNEIFESPNAEDMKCKDYLIKDFNQSLRYITLD